MTAVLRTDVLVIGGGAAGANAALKAADHGARVAMVVKGLLGKSGCSIFASHLPYYDESTSEKAADRFRYAVRYYNHYLTDQEHVRRMGAYMRTEFHAELERLGVYWLRGADDRPLNRRPGCRSWWRTGKEPPAPSSWKSAGARSCGGASR